ncbi:hypothetical protein GCM10025868_00320 [Angustibacter aerolatus]|uniref:PE domain-containing protein n=1 Tax=Angustibacter aerolatus TaxID=1162965 RepID=A0ABQ6JD18_9ACTN|nr:hypothetical protein GCM10025868_00320 [Angustibacter aerolatus]
MPETTPIIAVAALSPRLAEQTGRVRDSKPHEVAVREAVQQAGSAAVSALLPADDGSITDIPTPITPIVHRFDDTLRLQDLAAVRESLQQALQVVDGAVEALQPSADDVEVVRAEPTSALESLGR